MLHGSLLIGRGRHVDPHVTWCSKLGRQFPVEITGILAGACGHLCCQQIHDGTVLVGRPHGPVSPQEARSRTLLSAEAIGTAEQTFHKPFESNGHFAQLAPKGLDHPVDEKAADERLANG